MRTMTKAAIALAATILAATPATGIAQSDRDGRWEAWIGCWAPEGGTPRDAAVRAVCVIPAGTQAVELVTVADGKVASRERIDASGTPTPSTRESCAGEDAARWSADGRRVYLTSRHACGATKVTESGIMALPSANEWIDVRGVSVAGGPADVRVRRYVLLADASSLPRELAAEVGAAMGERPMLRAAVRANAAAELGMEQVIEASRSADASVVEAWLVENGDGFDVEAAQLRQLAKANVPDRVIDMVVALSFPDRFAVARRPGGTDVRPQVDTTVTRPTDVASRYGDLYGYNRRGRQCEDELLGMPASRCYLDSPYGYAPYGYSPYGWGGSTWGYGYGYAPGTSPVIVVRDGKDGGRVVKGKGYTRGESDDATSGRAAQPRTRTGDGGNSGNSGNSGSSGDRATTRSNGGSSSGSSSTKSNEGSSGTSSTGRTAKPRNP